jgi:tryptophan synthase alpha chain
MPDSASAAQVDPGAATGTARIGAAFEAARGERRAALMPYLMGGFPDQATATAIAQAYAEAGADLIELGVPFSDPLADGPVIHAADTAALAAGATLESVLETCAAVGHRVPVALMVYANMVLAVGPDEFAAAVGVTGERDELPAELIELTAAAREVASVPVAVGFGISTPGQAAMVGEIADGVIIGTRLVREVADAPDRDAAIRGVKNLLRETHTALARQPDRAR